MHRVGRDFMNTADQASSLAPPERSESITATRVLVVDDYEDNRTMLRYLLQRKGLQVLEACNGAEAVEIARRETPDLILMDLSMPFMDGFEATRHLKQLDSTKGIPVLALSANCNDSAQCAKALEAGCTDCFQKPLPFEKLEAYLKNL